MTDQPTITLNDGTRIPQLGLGVFQVPPPEAERLVRTALEVGYKAVDTAAFYQNEEGVGTAVREVDEWIYVTTKLWFENLGRDKTLKAFNESMAKLRLDKLDLYLIHWPAPARDLYVESWKAMAELRDQGRVTSIGVSNFTPRHLERLIGETGVVPVPMVTPKGLASTIATGPSMARLPQRPQPRRTRRRCPSSASSARTTPS